MRSHIHLGPRKKSGEFVQAIVEVQMTQLTNLRDYPYAGRVDFGGKQSN